MILEVTDLHSGYGRIPVLNGATLSVREGEILGILGHNGMGKTTLLRALIGHLPAKQGTITFLGSDLTRETPHARARAGLGYVPQGRGIFPLMSVRDNLRIGYQGRQLQEKETIERVLSEFPRLERLLDRIGGTLSGGEQQLLALARCLCGEPHLILLDEPTEGIQPSIIEEIAETLSTLNKKHRVSLVVVEQNLGFLTSLSETILQMQKGRIIGEVDPASLASSDPRLKPTPVTASHMRLVAS
jgi:branched-chain amino acid transport system ATP-binding protein